MKKALRMVPGLAFLALLLLTQPGLSQSTEDVKTLKEDVKALKEGQTAIQKDLQEIKKLLAARPAAAPAVDRTMDALVTTQGKPFKGDKNAKLTIIEFSEYQCPFCGRHFKDTSPQIEKEYVATGKAKLVFRDFPLESIHKFAFKAAEAANCAGEQNKFWEMHDRLFTNQADLAPEKLTDYAKAAGLDAAKFQQCLDGGKYAADIRKDIADGQSVGVTGTPTFLVGLTQPNDPKIKVARVLRGAQGYSSFKVALDSLLEEKEPAKQPAKAAEKQPEKPSR
jgi:protein-disulfide isomerase